MPIFEIEVSQIVVVTADDEFHAVDIAREIAPELSFQDFEYSHAVEIEDVYDLPTGWNGECLPFGGTDTKIKDLI